MLAAKYTAASIVCVIIYIGLLKSFLVPKIRTKSKTTMSAGHILFILRL